VTARELMSFGLNYKVMVKAPGDALETEDYKLKFVSYPSEVHLWEGLLAFEAERRILFSSDLFIHFDKLNDRVINSNINDEVNMLTEQQVPSPEAMKRLRDALLGLDAKDIAPGHGPYIKLWTGEQ
jgi:flavorubredoxin